MSLEPFDSRTRRRLGFLYWIETKLIVVCCFFVVVIIISCLDKPRIERKEKVIRSSLDREEEREERTMS